MRGRDINAHPEHQKPAAATATRQLQGSDPDAIQSLADRSARVLAQRRMLQPALGPQSSNRSVVQAKLNISSGGFTYEYFLGKDFRRDHVGGAERAIAVLRQRYQADHDDTAPVTTLDDLDGNHAATDVAPVTSKGSGVTYDFSLFMDVSGHTAYWDGSNRPKTFSIGSAVLSGYFLNGGSKGLITHISSTS